MIEEVKKKLTRWGLIAAAVAGAAFLIFAVWLNRGTLKIVAKAPYAVEIQNVKSQACLTDECAIVLAPGNYTVTVKKSGYQDQEVRVSVPMAGEHREEITLQYLPVFSLIGGGSGQDVEDNAASVSAIAASFNEPKRDLPGLPKVPLFYEKNYVVYLSINPQTRWQTLYARAITEGAATLGEPQILATFPRTLKKYTVVPSIEEHQAVAVLEQADDESIVYVVDMKEKTREAVIRFPRLANSIRWLPGTKDFLISAREPGESQERVFWYSFTAKDTYALDVQASLQNVVPLGKDRLMAATQPASGGVNFVDYSLVTHQSRLLLSAPQAPMPQQMKLEGNGKSILMLADSQVYRLQFEE